VSRTYTPEELAVLSDASARATRALVDADKELWLIECRWKEQNEKMRAARLACREAAIRHELARDWLNREGPKGLRGSW
jgi:hypothetical protein